MHGRCNTRSEDDQRDAYTSGSEEEDVSDGRDNIKVKYHSAQLLFFGGIVSVLLLRVYVRLPLMLILVMRYGFEESWVVTLVTVALIEVLIIIVFFGMVIDVIWPTGFLVEWLF